MNSLFLLIIGNVELALCIVFIILVLKNLILLKKCRCKGIAIGVEHAHPEVFKLVNKGETLKQIWDACKLIKKHKMELALTFIIGLPKDNLEFLSKNEFEIIRSDICNDLRKQSLEAPLR